MKITTTLDIDERILFSLMSDHAVQTFVNVQNEAVKNWIKLFTTSNWEQK